VLVVGDVNSTMACALVAAKLGIPVAHVEAGLRSFDRSMPEEINRVVTDALSTYLFTPSRDADENLRREGVAGGRVHFVGNVMIDSLRRFLPRVSALRAHAAYGLAPRGYALLTLHRPTNVDRRDPCQEILAALEVIARRVPVLFPLHPRTRKSLAALGLEGRLRAMAGVIATEPMGYLEFLSLQQGAAFVMTDSGGVQEETTVLGIPCLTLRENTERPVTISEGTNQLVKPARDAIIDKALEVLHEPPRAGRIPEFWDGRAAERIVRVLLGEAMAPEREATRRGPAGLSEGPDRRTP
jgi:UDP-N-acetylglucosamine 2-epimerase (non-hydrolysing)